MGHQISDGNEKICACVVLKDKQDESAKATVRPELLEHCKEEKVLSNPIILILIYTNLE